MIFKLSENKIDTKMPEMFKNILSPYSLPERKQHTGVGPTKCPRPTKCIFWFLRHYKLLSKFKVVLSTV